MDRASFRRRRLGKYEDLTDDFYKLLDIKAYVKVFICSPNKRVLENLPARLAKEIARHQIKHSDEAYLLIIIPEYSSLKKEGEIIVEGYSIDYQGKITKLGDKHFYIGDGRKCSDI